MSCRVACRIRQGGHAVTRPKFGRRKGVIRSTSSGLTGFHARSHKTVSAREVAQARPGIWPELVRLGHAFPNSTVDIMCGWTHHVGTCAGLMLLAMVVLSAACFSQVAADQPELTLVPVAVVQDEVDGFYALYKPTYIETLTMFDRTYAFVLGRGEKAIQIMDVTNPAFRCRQARFGIWLGNTSMMRYT